MIELKAGASVLTIDADNGASITSWWSQTLSGTRHWLVPETPYGSFLMVPFASRLYEGTASFQGRNIELPVNVRGEPYPIHGFAWQNPWQVETFTGNAARLSFQHESPASSGWPWRFQAVLQVLLEERCLKLTLEVINQGPQAMPAGLGFHPYFSRTPQTLLSASVAHRWHLDACGIPQAPYIESVNAGALENLSVSAHEMDAVFSAWDGRVDIRWPEWQAGLTMLSDASHLVLYSPANEDFFCVEPVTNVPNGFNLPAELDTSRYQIVEAGQSRCLEVQLQLKWSG